LLDQILKPLLNKIPSYIKDSFDFLDKLPKITVGTTLFVSFDVVSLYTNIPHELGLEALDFYLTKYADIINSRFSRHFILKAMELILTHNIFKVNDEYYIQTCGTAMGASIAPTYANLTMGYLEEKLYNTFIQNKPWLADYIKNNFFRYLDDCFIILNESYITLEELLGALNNLHNKINFTYEKSPTKLNFLDVLVQKDGFEILQQTFFINQQIILTTCIFTLITHRTSREMYHTI
jgi:hypothetical protein